jgi:hypothetical protein
MTIPAKAINPPAAMRSPVRPGTISPVTITARTTTTRTTEGQLIFPKGVGNDGRYWARTSDLQLVELALSQLS